MSDISTPIQSTETVVLENDDVRVIRIIIPPGALHVPSSRRNKRVVVWLKSSNNTREEIMNDNADRSQVETLARVSGDVGWREPSEQTIHNTGSMEMESLLIELKNKQ